MNLLSKIFARKSATKHYSVVPLTTFISKFAQYGASSDYLKCYRGQRNAAWKNTPGIFRPELQELLCDEKRAIRDLISVQPHEFSSDDTMFEKLVRMQHYGLPTRLMDVSLNALVALYFATDPSLTFGKPTNGQVTAFSIPPEREKYFDSDSVSCLANLANMTAEEKMAIDQLRLSLKDDLSDDRNIKSFNEVEVIKRLHQFIRAEKPYFQAIVKPIDLFKPYFVHPKLSNRRILAQSGAFIVYGNPSHGMFFPDIIGETSFVVPFRQKKAIRIALERLGISESTLFPEIDKAAERIKNRYTS